MIISASRRTDIPAFYGKWFINRLREGFVMTRNPYNYNSVSRLSLTPTNIDTIVFWTKNPEPFIEYLDEMDAMGYNYYFLYTITPYKTDIEPNVPDLNHRIETFKKLASKISAERVIWRYDPIIITDKYTADYHLLTFEKISNALINSTNQCYFSFVEMYKKCIKNMAEINYSLPNVELKKSFVSQLSMIGKANKIKLYSCASDIEYTEFGVSKGSCISEEMINKITNKHNIYAKDKSQRMNCGCVKSYDIGTYHTCLNHCKYCYANDNISRVNKTVIQHDTTSPFLIGN